MEKEKKKQWLKKKKISMVLALDQIFIIRSALAQSFVVLASQGTIKHFIV